MQEVNFDGLVGPTHNYGGLSFGNIASMNHRFKCSSPKQAALQGLEKAKAVRDLGLVQGIVPPQLRPDFDSLRNLGFTGSDEEVLKKAFAENPILLNICCSSSFMWTANAATVAPSADTVDGKLHLTPANLRVKPHRAIEHQNTYKSLGGIFKNQNKFVVHKALELGDAFSDEGAANHTRFENPKTKQGLHFFVYGREAMNNLAPMPKRFPARQTLEASQAVARLNNIKPDQVIFAQQNPAVIDAGVFHNDVISVGFKNVFFYHETAFLNTKEVIERINDKLDGQLISIRVNTNDVSIVDAVESYLFNSQIIATGTGDMALIAPEHCKTTASVKNFIDNMVASDQNPINQVYYFNLLQSMQNGGGPACLRLRVQMTNEEIMAINQKCVLSDETYKNLTAWVNKHYRNELKLEDLASIQLAEEVHAAHAELEDILNLPGLYY